MLYRKYIVRLCHLLILFSKQPSFLSNMLNLAFVVVSVICYSHSNKKQLQLAHVCVKNNQLLQQVVLVFKMFPLRSIKISANSNSLTWSRNVLKIKFLIDLQFNFKKLCINVWQLKRLFNTHISVVFVHDWRIEETTKNQYFSLWN